MASLKELDAILSAYYTLSNKKILLIAHVRDETIYFYDNIDSLTTVILLASPKSKVLKQIFLECMNKIGATVVDLDEQETFDPKYQMSAKSTSIIKKLLSGYKYQYIITHPRYTKESDSQNRALYDIAEYMCKNLGTYNHYTFGYKEKNNRNMINPRKEYMIRLYCKVLGNELLENYMNVGSTISDGLIKI
jgi:hypothetical protein